MRKNDWPAAIGRIRKITAKTAGAILALALVTAYVIPSSVAATEAEPGEETPMPEESEEISGIPAPEAGEEISGTPMPEEGGEIPGTPTPEPGEDISPTPTWGPSEEVPATPTPKPEEGDIKDQTPTPEPSPTPKPTKEPEEDSEVTPTPKPTKKPKPSPTPKPGEGEDSDTGPTGEPDTGQEKDPDAEPTEEPTPTPTPRPVYPVEVPTESNDARFQYLFGINAREITVNNPIPGYDSGAAVEKHLRKITVPIWKMSSSGGRYSSNYKIMVHEKLARNIKAIFQEIYDLEIQFPIKEMKAYTYYRKVGGVGLSNTTLISPHSFGAAIDINPGDYDNDYYLGKGNDLRDKSNPYCIPDEVIEIFAKYGWFWGGDFDICADTMHFQYLGLDSLSYQNNSPFRTLKVQRGYMKGIDVRNLQQRLCEVGYRVTVDGVYGSKTASAVKKYQKNKGLPATGTVDYKTWETIINETHYMPYAF